MNNITPEMAMAELARRELARRGKLNPDSQEMKAANNGIGSIPGDIADMGANLLMAAGEKAMKLPDEISEAAHQLYEHPLKAPPRASQNILSGLTEGAKGLYNLPLNLNTYLGSKGVFPFKQTMGLAEHLKIGNTGLKKAVLGEPQKGDALFQDIGQIAPMFIAPETIGIKVPAVTSKGVMKQLSKEKFKQLDIAKKDYSKLFKEAEDIGLRDALPTLSVVKNQEQIVKNSVPKHHTALKDYLKDPTLEKAHWAQSELGALQRHLDFINKKSGLTPTQIKTYKAVEQTRKDIKKSMFSKNSLGKHPVMGMRYDTLANKYRENVIPYTSLEDLSEFEAGKLRPKTAVKNLLNDEEFMLNLSRKNPGIFLHTPFSKKVQMGAAGLLGYEELKKLLKNNLG